MATNHKKTSIALITATFALIPHRKYATDDFALAGGSGDFFICRTIPNVFFPEVKGADNVILTISNKRFKASKRIRIRKIYGGIFYETQLSAGSFIYPELERELFQFFPEEDVCEIFVYFNCRVGSGQDAAAE